MSKKILLIDSDSPFASELSRALEHRGLDVRATIDGASGMDLARDQRPDAIVLCVELPKMSGYAVCQRIRKDEALRNIPLVITSSEATPETFENHKKLKVRADAYLHKPFDAGALLQALSGLIALPEAPPPAEDLVTLDDVEELSGEMPLVPLHDEEPRAGLPADDEDLKLLDNAFDHIAGEAPGTAAAPLVRADPHAGAGEALRAAAALLPEEGEAAPSEIDRLGEEADRALAALGNDEPAEVLDLDTGSMLGGAPPTPPAHGDTDDLLRAAGIHVASAEPSHAAEVQRLQDRVSELLIDLARARETAEKREGEAAQLRGAVASLEARLQGQDSDHSARAGEAQRALEETRSEAEQRLAATRAELQQRLAATRAELQQRLASAQDEAQRQVEAVRAELQQQLASAQDEAQRQVEAARAEGAREAEARARAEAAQRQAEEAQQRAEEARQQAEQARLAADQGRLAADQARLAAEEAHRRHEEGRAHAEDARARAEEARVRAEEQAQKIGERAGSLEAEVAGLRLRVEESEQSHSLKAAQLAEAQDHHQRLGHELTGLQGQLAEALGLRPQLEALRGELDVVRADAESARAAAERRDADAERRAAELQGRVGELETVNAKHEERIVKAYQKIKSDEKIREKTRKALAIALQLLDERLVAPATPAPKEVEPVPRRE